jgi:hypothetical protein
MTSAIERSPSGAAGRIGLPPFFERLYCGLRDYFMPSSTMDIEELLWRLGKSSKAPRQGRAAR